MTQIPGLRHRVEEALGEVMESAVEFARSYGHHVLRPDEPMKLRIGNFIVWYALDTTRASAKVVFIEVASREEATARRNDDASASFDAAAATRRSGVA